MKIIAIGGGHVFMPCQLPETFAIDQEIVRLGRQVVFNRGHRKPRVLFIPTASDDNIEYCHSIYTVYELLLGCKFDHLRLLAEKLDDEEISRKISWADIIYVGGGNTLKMMKVWRKRGVDKLLLRAYLAGTVMSGLSAGAICWFSWGCSDSLKKTDQKVFKPTRVSGLGFLPQAICPHWDSEGDWRQQVFPKMLFWLGPVYGLGLALDDCCALELVDGRMRFISSQPGKSAYRLQWVWSSKEVGRRLSITKLCCTRSFRPYHLYLV